MASNLGDRRLYRSARGRMLGGVCGGLGEYFGLDPVVVRLGFVLVTLAGGAGVLAYLILWIAVPSEPPVDGQVVDPAAWSGQAVAALSLIVLGLVLLAGTAGWVSRIGVEILWPGLLILLGLILLVRR